MVVLSIMANTTSKQNGVSNTQLLPSSEVKIYNRRHKCFEGRIENKRGTQEILKLKKAQQ